MQTSPDVKKEVLILTDRNSNGGGNATEAADTLKRAYMNGKLPAFTGCSNTFELECVNKV